MTWLWLFSYKKMLSIEKDFVYISISKVFSQKYITFGTEAGIVLEWGK